MKKKLPPFSLSLTFEERARLEDLAGDIPLGTYIKRKVFDGKGLRTKRARSRTRRPIKDEQGTRSRTRQGRCRSKTAL